jgi:hypothetical protein
LILPVAQLIRKKLCQEVVDKLKGKLEYLRHITMINKGFRDFCYYGLSRPDTLNELAWMIESWL